MRRCLLSRQRPRRTGDVEEGNAANNSHPSPVRATKTEKANDSDGGKDEKMEIAADAHGKERSVLQAKLTKLAIQIGYAGTKFDART